MGGGGIATNGILNVTTIDPQVNFSIEDPIPNVNAEVLACNPLIRLD